MIMLMLGCVRIKNVKFRDTVTKLIQLALKGCVNVYLCPNDIGGGAEEEEESNQ